MAERITVTLAPGQILSEVGAEIFRQKLINGHTVRCGDRWIASVEKNDGEAPEIQLRCCRNPETDRWETEVYYFSFERAIGALREYEETGNFPEGE